VTEKSRALPAGMYRDPLEYLITEEEKTCAGCTHKTEEKQFGIVFAKCSIKGKKYGRRCSRYVEKPGIHG
jgi:hypothetical protein